MKSAKLDFVLTCSPFITGSSSTNESDLLTLRLLLFFNKNKI